MERRPHTSTERLALPAGILSGAGGLSVELASTALVGLGEGARYVTDYPYQCAEQVASRALALMLASDLGGAFQLQGIEPAEYRAQAEGALRALAMYQCPNGGFALWSGECTSQSAYLTAYVLHAMNVAGTLKYDGQSRCGEFRAQLPATAVAPASAGSAVVAGMGRLAGVLGEGARGVRSQSGRRHLPARGFV